jgi:nicotinate-nucleotide--dimethylbenzimidazole phosphoribosyltransferase
MKIQLLSREAPQCLHPDARIRAEAQHVMDTKTKPLGALGRIESLAVDLCVMQNTLSPCVERKLMLVFAGDHGLTEEGISAYPREVTRQMVRNFADGGAAINVICRQYDIELHVIDIGVDGDIPASDGILGMKIRPGTRNSAVTDAMTRDEAIRALEAGMTAFDRFHTREPVQILGLGEMGIGNTSSSALMISALSETGLEDLIGRGTGVDDVQLAHKKKVLRKVFAFHRLDRRPPVEVLCTVGGFEIAGMAGAALAASAAGVPVVLDGVISTAAGLLAVALEPCCREYLIIGHRSVEPAQKAAARVLGLEPVLDLEMRLGEGTGAALTMNLAETACRILREMASFDDAGVSGKV